MGGAFGPWWSVIASLWSLSEALPCRISQGQQCAVVEAPRYNHWGTIVPGSGSAEGLLSRGCYDGDPLREPIAVSKPSRERFATTGGNDSLNRLGCPPSDLFGGRCESLYMQRLFWQDFAACRR